MGYACDVIAPALIPQRSGVHRTHNKRDAADLARLYRVGELVAVRIASEADERVRTHALLRDARIAVALEAPRTNVGLRREMPLVVQQVAFGPSLLLDDKPHRVADGVHQGVIAVTNHRNDLVRTSGERCVRMRRHAGADMHDVIRIRRDHHILGTWWRIEEEMEVTEAGNADAAGFLDGNTLGGEDHVDGCTDGVALCWRYDLHGYRCGRRQRYRGR